MRIVYSEKHLLPAPQDEFDGKAGVFRPNPEVPQRAIGILESLRERRTGEVIPPRQYAPDVLTGVHDPALIDFYWHGTQDIYYATACGWQEPAWPVS